MSYGGMGGIATMGMANIEPDWGTQYGGNVNLSPGYGPKGGFGAQGNTDYGGEGSSGVGQMQGRFDSGSPFQFGNTDYGGGMTASAGVPTQSAAPWMRGSSQPAPSPLSQGSNYGGGNYSPMDDSMGSGWSTNMGGGGAGHTPPMSMGGQSMGLPGHAAGQMIGQPQSRGGGSSGQNGGYGGGYGGAPSVSQSSSQPGMIPGMMGVYNQLLGINQEHYGNVMNAYQQGQGNLSQNLPGIYSGYDKLGGDVQNTLGMGQVLGQNGNWGVAGPAAQAIGDTFAQSQANTTQQYTNAGLGNTTAVGSAQNQNAQMAGRQYANLGAQLANEAAGYQSQIGQAGLGSRMQGLGMQTGLTQGALGPMGQQESNTAGQLSGTYGNSYSGPAGGGGGLGMGGGGIGGGYGGNTRGGAYGNLGNWSSSVGTYGGTAQQAADAVQQTNAGFAKLAATPGSGVTIVR